MSELAQISPVRVKLKKAARLAAQGVKYEDIAVEIGSRAKPENRRQAVYSSLQTITGKEETRKIEKELARKYTVEDCLAELEEAKELAVKKQHVPGLAAVIMGKAKVAGLLIDQVKDVTEPVSRDLLDKRAKDSLSQLQVSAEGIESADNVPKT